MNEETQSIQADLYDAIVNHLENTRELFQLHTQILNLPIKIETCGDPECVSVQMEEKNVDNPELLTDYIRKGKCEHLQDSKEKKLAVTCFVHIGVLCLNLECIQLLAEQHCDFNVRTMNCKDTALHKLIKMDRDEACVGQDLENRLHILDTLLNNHADANLVSLRDGDSPLMSASERGSIEILKRLLAVDHINLEYKTPDIFHGSALITSIIFQDIEKCRLLLKAGADVNTRARRGCTPLMQANSLGIEFLQLLFDFGATVNVVDKDGATPLSNAISYGSYEEVLWLLQNGADPNMYPCPFDNLPMLVYACINCPSNVTLALIQHGADVSVIYQNRGCLNFTSEPDVVKAMLDAGADPNSRSDCGNTPLVRALWHKKIESVKLLLDAEVDVNNVDKEGDTPLHYAAYSGNYDAVKLLLDKGARPSVKNYAAGTPIWYAVYSGNISIVKTLIHLNVDLKSKSRGTTLRKGGPFLFPKPMTPLHVAVHQNYEDIALLLFQCQCYLNHEDWLRNFDLSTVNSLEEKHAKLYLHFKRLYDQGRVPTLSRLCTFFCRDLFGQNIDKVSELQIPNDLKQKIALKDFT